MDKTSRRKDPGRAAIRKYEAKYNGTFVWRHAFIKGTRIWSDGGKTIGRACSGTVKRPLRVFLPRERKWPAKL